MSVLLFLPLLSTSVAAYTWQFTNTPRQCQDLSFSVSGGKPPYRVLIIPNGASPFGSVEVRKIVDHNFTNSDTSTTFKLNYPTNSAFVAVMSDASGFGSGGVSIPAIVLDSSDSSCFDKTKGVQPPWFINIDPPNQIVQCQKTRIWWDPSGPQGPPQFQGVIPGGQAFTIPVGSTTQEDGKGTGFDYTPSIVNNNVLILIGGDNRGWGSGGSTTNTVGAGTNPDGSCLNSTSPSSTAGSPAGGTYPTSTSGASTGGSGSSTKHDTAAIAGGVVGGVVGAVIIMLIVLFFWRRKRLHKRGTEKNQVDLLQEDDEGGNTELPQFYRPEPFIVPEPTAAEGSGSAARPLSGATTSYTRSDTPDGESTVAGTSVSGRKSVMKPLRPVNIIQHDDAGPTEGAQEDAETVELPPAYTNIRK